MSEASFDGIQEAVMMAEAIFQAKKHQEKHGPFGTGKDWEDFILISICFMADEMKKLEAQNEALKNQVEDERSQREAAERAVEFLTGRKP